ncbi:MAG: hypothetical protein JNL01_14125 [Bdellovibrionales bacterium]|nr:hypothetical protein [Bdellovibrionales bacterium]
MAEAKFLAVAIDADTGQSVKIENSPAGEGAIRIRTKNRETIDLWLCDLKTILRELENWQQS